MVLVHHSLCECVAIVIMFMYTVGLVLVMLRDACDWCMHSPLGVAGSVLICGIRCSTRLNFVTFICRHVPERFSCDVSGFDVCVLMCLLSWRDVVSCLWHDFYIQIFGVYIYIYMWCGHSTCPVESVDDKCFACQFWLKVCFVSGLKNCPHLPTQESDDILDDNRCVGTAMCVLHFYCDFGVAIWDSFVYHCRFPIFVHSHLQLWVDCSCNYGMLPGVWFSHVFPEDDLFDSFSGDPNRLPGHILQSLRDPAQERLFE